MRTAAEPSASHAPVQDTAAVVLDRSAFLALAAQVRPDTLPAIDTASFTPDVLYPGDQLGLSLYEKLPISMEKRVELQRVDGRGNIFLLPVGAIRVGGLSSLDAERFIEKKLAQFVKSPHVEIAIIEREVARKTVYVFGAVGKQGSYAFKDGYRLLDLMADAGGVNQSVFARSVRLIRQDGGSVVMTTINLNTIFRHGQIQGNLLLRNQDIVYVPDKFYAPAQEILGVVIQALPWYYFFTAFGR